MIKNIITDVGQVILKFKCYDCLKDITDNEEEYRFLCSITFDSPNWTRYDKGDFQKNDFEEYLKSFTQTDKQKAQIHELMLCWRNYLELNQPMVDLIHKFKSNGYKLYILSNAPYEVPVYLNSYHMIQLFDGTVFSCYERVLKPEKKIYQNILNRYNLKPEESLFIDDRKVNIASAKELGFNVFEYEYDEHENAIEEIKKMGIKID